MPAFLYGPSSAYHCAGPYQNGSLNHSFGLQPESHQNPPCASKKFFKFLTSIPQHHIWTSRPDTDADGYPTFPPAHFRSQPLSRRSFFIFCQGETFRLREPAWMVCLRRTVEKRRHLDRVFCGLTCPLRFSPSESESAADISSMQAPPHR